MLLRTYIVVLLFLIYIEGSSGFSTSPSSPHQGIHRSNIGGISAFREPGDSYNNRHSASDWWYNVRSINKSKVLQEVRGPVISVGLWGFAVSALHRLLQSRTNPILQAIGSHMSIPGTAHSFLVSALGLLLVFRTNSAYQRFYVSPNTPFDNWCISNLTLIIAL